MSVSDWSSDVCSSDLAAIIRSLDWWSFLMQRSSPSLSERERQFHCLVRSSVAKTKKDKKKTEKQKRKEKIWRSKSLKKGVSPPHKEKRNQLALRVMLLRREKQSLQEGTIILLPRESWRRNQLPKRQRNLVGTILNSWPMKFWFGLNT